MEYKVSGTGWFCVNINDNWVPCFKLNSEQLNRFLCTQIIEPSDNQLMKFHELKLGFELDYVVEISD